MAAMDLQYHDLRPEKSLFTRLDMERLVTDDEVESGITEPPEDTRAYFRGTCLARFADAIVAANWDSMVFDVGEDPLRRVPMMEPHVEAKRTWVRCWKRARRRPSSSRGSGRSDRTTGETDG